MYNAMKQQTMKSNSHNLMSDLHVNVLIWISTNAEIEINTCD